MMRLEEAGNHGGVTRASGFPRARPVPWPRFSRSSPRKRGPRAHVT